MLQQMRGFAKSWVSSILLGGLALAVGILVDDATVTIENIERHLEEGHDLHTAILEGAAQLVWGTQVHALDLGISQDPIVLGGIYISTFDLVAALVAGGLVLALSLFFRFTRTGLAFRAVADDQFAALAVGLRLDRTWATVWTAAGVVALVAGLLWGARLGVQFSLSLIVLKALPVLVLGGFDSILGAIIGGLVIGATENLAEVFIGPYFGGGIEGWFAYAVALVVLLVRPTGLFGQKLVERY